MPQAPGTRRPDGPPYAADSGGDGTRTDRRPFAIVAGLVAATCLVAVALAVATVG